MVRTPRHIGIIPDGNRRWAVARGLPKKAGYEGGLSPVLELLPLCLEANVQEVTAYGFTQDNAKRARDQTEAFRKACVNVADILTRTDVILLVIGDTSSPMFPEELLSYTSETKFGSGKIKVNLLINYSWQWDLNPLFAQSEPAVRSADITKIIRSSKVSRIDLVIRWGGRTRLSGFLPVQTVYSDMYVVDEYWPDFQPEHFFAALDWYSKQDITLGG
jgi:undecaprenyl diphosphate synthase